MEDGVGLIAAVGRHRLGGDLVLVQGVPPIFDDLLMAGLIDDRRPVICRPFLDRARVDRLEYVALIVPHRPPQAEPSGVHRHSADVAPFYLAGLLPFFADLNQLMHGLRHLILPNQSGPEVNTYPAMYP